MSAATTWGAALGGTVGLGCWLVAARLLARRPTLDRRLAPYLRPATHAPSTLEPRAPLTTIEQLLAPVMSDAVRLVERYGSPTADLRRRLRQAGRPADVTSFRAEQVVWAVTGTAAGLAAALLLVVVRQAPLVLALLVVALGAATGALGRDQVLTWQVGRRGRRLVAELPAIAELLALAVAAGEGALGALDRVTRTTAGALANELGTAVAATRTGVPLSRALDDVADRTGVPAVARFCEAVSVAVERGTPLAEVLRAQAQDAREAGRRELMETGGRKEIAMLVPVVLLILPVTVVFAAFPAVLALRLQL